jgi:hypothetical protein
MGVVIDLPRRPVQAPTMFVFAERQLADALMDVNNDLRAFALQLLAVDWGRTRWPCASEEQAILATRLIELGRRLQAHAGGSDGAA